MLRFLRILASLVFLSLPITAQVPAPPASQAHLNHFRYLLMKLGSINYSADFIRAAEQSMVQQYGLNQQELQVFRAAAMNVRTVLLQNHQAALALLNGRNRLSPSDLTSLVTLANQRDQVIAAQANLILSSVRPDTAQRLRLVADNIANRKR